MSDKNAFILIGWYTLTKITAHHMTTIPGVSIISHPDFPPTIRYSLLLSLQQSQPSVDKGDKMGLGNITTD